MTQVVGLGAGGHAKVVIEVLRRMGRYEIVGLLDARRELWSTKISGVDVLGDDSMLPELKGRGISEAFIGVGTVGDAGPRRELYERVTRLGFQLVSAFDPAAVISASASIGAGPTVMAGAIINAHACLGDNVIVNTGAIVEHDCVVGDHAHIATGACLAGGVHVGRGAHIGLGAMIRQGIHIGEDAIVGAGAVVVRDVPNRIVVVGVPAKTLERAENR